MLVTTTLSTTYRLLHTQYLNRYFESLLPEKPVRFGTGTYSVPMESPIGPFHFEAADIFDAPYIYAGRVIHDRAGQLNLIGFLTASHDSKAPCEISDPIPVQLTANGTLQVK